MTPANSNIRSSRRFSALRNRQRSRQNSPRLEILEPRQLLTNVISTPAIAPGWQINSPITVPDGQSVQIPINDANLNNLPLNYTINSSNPNITATLRSGTFIQITLTGAVAGTMVFELFNDLTPNTAAYIASTVQSGFYNNTVINSVAPGFAAQAGDPTGTGSYIPFNIPDEFKTGLIYDGNGQLGMFQTGHDANSTQFFISDGNQQADLDYQFTLFGQLVSGFNIFSQLMNTPVDSNNTPTTAVTISSATVIQDTQDAVLTLTANSNTPFTSTTNVTISTNDGQGFFSSQLNFTVEAIQDTNTELPFLGPTPLNYTTPENTQIRIPIPAIDTQGFLESFTAVVNPSTPDGTVVITQLPGSVEATVTPTPGFTGLLEIQIAVYPSNNPNAADTRILDIGVGAAPLSLTSANATLNADSNAPTPLATFTTPDTSAGASDFTATVYWSNGQPPSTGMVTQNADGSFTVTGTIINPYANQGNYTGILKITEDDGAGLTTNLAITVNPSKTAIYQRYVTQLYTDLLDRNVDPGGLASWTAKLNAGMTYQDIALAITGSREYDGDIVDAFYVTYLNRHAETFGLTNWVNEMQSGLNAEVIRAGILGSQEYYNDTGGTDTLYVTALYQTFLNRAPDPGGLASWVAQLGGNPANRQGVASGISNSDENRTDIITAFYETYLHRAPDGGGLAYWKGLLANGISQPAIISAFVTSPEYLARYNIT